MQLRDFIVANVSQVALIGIQMSWTAKMTEAFEKASNKNEKGIYDQKKKEINAMMDVLTQMCLEEHKSTIDRTKIETLVTIMVHQKELTAELKCKDVNDFDW
jgi:dynein heavy chain